MSGGGYLEGGGLNRQKRFVTEDRSNDHPRDTHAVVRAQIALYEEVGSLDG